MVRKALDEEVYTVIRRSLLAGVTVTQAGRDAGVPHSTANRVAKALALYGGTNLRGAAFRVIVDEGPIAELANLVTPVARFLAPGARPTWNSTRAPDRPGVWIVSTHDLAHVLWDLQKQALITFRESKRETNAGSTRLYNIRATSATYARLGISADPDFRTDEQYARALAEAEAYRLLVVFSPQPGSLLPAPPAALLAERPDPVVDRLVHHGEPIGHAPSALPRIPSAPFEPEDLVETISAPFSFPLLRQLVMRRTKVTEAIQLLREAGVDTVADLAAESIAVTPFEAEVLRFLEYTGNLTIQAPGLSAVASGSESIEAELAELP